MARGRIEPLSRVIAVSGPPDGNSTVALVDKLLVDQGSKVEAGQVVAILNGFELSRTDYEVAKANLSLAELQRAQVRAGVGKVAEIAAQLNVLAGRRAQLVRLKKDFTRVTALVRNQNASVQDADTQQAQLTQGENDVEQAQNALKALTEVRAVDDAVASGQIAVAHANVAKAQAVMERLQIRAPTSGTVLSIQTRASEAIQADGILRMGDLAHLIVVAEVDEGQIGRVTEGMTATIEGDMVPQPVKATVTRIAKEVFRQKRPSSDILIGRDAKIVEVELTPQTPLPPVVGGEVVVRLSPPSSSANNVGNNE
ncbi:MAG TPA: HlyD family efflux transporter periplasmic adaptor subunit [Stellaceae bacterium]|nr:HlyD family efflux transporter periplasmic adaptor subunit [Stellaceae bacterium]